MTRPSGDVTEAPRDRGTSARPPWRRKRIVLPPLVALVVALCVFAGSRYVAALRAVDDGRREVTAARQLLTGDLGHLDRLRIEQARAHLEAASGDFGPRADLLEHGILSRAASHLPGIGPNVRAARALRGAGIAGVRLGLDMLRLVDDVLPSDSTSGASALERVVDLAGAHRDEIDRAGVDMDRLRAAVAAVPTDPLIGPLDRARRTVVDEGTRVVTTAAPAVSLLRALPVAIGPGHHAYLLLLANPGEERPGGGFIGAVGEVAFQDGALSGLDFRGSEGYGPSGAGIPAPAALDRFLFHGSHWELSDANWSPDFPTAMADAERLYARATGHKVDGAIEVDPVALGYVLEVLGPARVPGFPQVVTGSNALLELNYIINRARPGDPGKGYLPPFGRFIVGQLLRTPVVKMPPLARGLQRGAHEKHIALSFHDPRLQTLVDGAGYGGRLGAPVGDSLLVADANLSGTKGDLFVTRSMHLTVNVGRDGDATNELRLHYMNPEPAPADTAARVLLDGSGGDYRDYLRVYLPETAHLQSLTLSSNGGPARPVGPEAVTYEFGHASVAYWLVVPHGASADLTLRYSGPFADLSVVPERYQLDWFKQVNAQAWPVEVTVKMPDGRHLHRSAKLDADRSWSLG